MELDWNWEKFHNKCLTDKAFLIVVAGRISIRSSRQGVKHELIVIEGINKFLSKNYGVFVQKPNKDLSVYKDSIIHLWDNRKKNIYFRTLDAIVSGKVNGYLFCKFCMQGGILYHQLMEGLNLMRWAIKVKFKANLFFLIETMSFNKNHKILLEMKSISRRYTNIFVFTHVEFQEWIIEIVNNQSKK